jgi:DnaJ like chaperone protein
MGKYAKWIGGGLGWAFGGPIGAFVGFMFGSMFDKMNSEELALGQGSTRAGDFAISLLILSAAVMKADGKVLKSELNYVKQFLANQFGESHARELLKNLKEILDKDIPLRDVSMQIGGSMDHASRLQLMHYLFGIANADGVIDKSELNIIEQIAGYLRISQKDFTSIKAMFIDDTSSAYKILEINSNASNDEVKKAYRKMALKYHPDKVSHLGEDFQKAAEDKFQKVNDAYQKIKKERGFS